MEEMSTLRNGGKVLTATSRPLDLGTEENVLVEMSWTVKPGAGTFPRLEPSFSLSEAKLISMEAVYYLINTVVLWRPFFGTIYWPEERNTTVTFLSSTSLWLVGDEAVLRNNDEDDSKEENDVAEEEKEYIEFNVLTHFHSSADSTSSAEWIQQYRP